MIYANMGRYDIHLLIHFCGAPYRSTFYQPFTKFEKKILRSIDRRVHLGAHLSNKHHELAAWSPAQIQSLCWFVLVQPALNLEYAVV